jgi:hypothetical protein
VKTRGSETELIDPADVCCMLMPSDAEELSSLSKYCVKNLAEVPIPYNQQYLPF